MNGRAAAAFLPAAVLAAGCNVILDKEELKKGSSDADTDADTDTDTETDELNCEGGRLDPSTNLCWQHPKAGGFYTWYQAKSYCYELDLAGHSDWILPSRDDFIDLLGGCDSDVMSGIWGNCNSCAESEACGAMFGSDTDRHWSSSPSTQFDSCAWYVNFDNGYVDDGDVDSGRGVRCVR
jgi:hypothetical protein